MTKLIGLKELQTNTKKIREEVTQGIRFIVVYRSKPVFEINPISQVEFSNDLQATGLYSDTFIERMKEAEDDIKNGRTKTYDTNEFLKSLS